MTLGQRRIIYLSFMAVFFIVLPLIILQANGYRFNFKKSVLQKTGIIFLESQPEKVEVWLNNTFIDDQTPLRIKNLLPNQYQLKLTKEGYKDWVKSVPVVEGQINNLQYIRLFKDSSIPQMILAADILEIIKTNDQNELILLAQAETGKYAVSLFNLTNNQQVEIWSGWQEVEDLKLIDNDNKLVVRTENNSEIFDVDNQTRLFNARTELNFRLADKLKVDEYNGNFVYWLENDKLVQLNLFNQEKIRLPYLMTDYLVDGSDIYFLSNPTLNKSWLQKVNLQNIDEVINLVALESDRDYAITDITNQMVVIRDEDNQELILWNMADQEKEVIKGVNYYSWNDNYDQLLFGNDWELWSYRINEEKDKYILFTRLGETINEAIWYPIGTHIFYVVENRIKLTENLLSNRYTTNLTELEVIKNIVINKKGDKLYFIGQVGKQQGLYALEIQ